MNSTLQFVLKRALLLIVLAVALSACDEKLIHDLSEGEVNRVVSRLHKGGIAADKIQQADGRWSVSIPQGEMVRALSVLDTSRVLARRSVGEERKSKGSFIPSREEQWFQYESQVAGSLEATLLTLPGVVDAHVHLKLPPSDPLLGTRDAGQGSGSVLLLIEAEAAGVEIHEADIAKVVAGGAGIPADRVRVLKSVSGATSTYNDVANGSTEVGASVALTSTSGTPAEEVLATRTSNMDTTSLGGRVVEGEEKGNEYSVMGLRVSLYLLIVGGVCAVAFILMASWFFLRARKRKREIFALRKSDLLGEMV